MKREQSAGDALTIAWGGDISVSGFLYYPSGILSASGLTNAQF